MLKDEQYFMNKSKYFTGCSKAKNYKRVYDLVIID